MIQGIFLTAIFVLAAGVSSNAGELGTIEDRAISFVETLSSLRMILCFSDPAKERLTQTSVRLYSVRLLRQSQVWVTPTMFVPTCLKWPEAGDQLDRHRRRSTRPERRSSE